MAFNDENTALTSSIEPAAVAASREAGDGHLGPDAEAAQTKKRRNRRLCGLRIRPKSMSPTPMLITGSLAIIAFFSIDLSSSGFLSVGNVQSVVAQATVISILAVGNVFVLTAGEIDLSFANVVPLSGVTLALLTPDIGI